MYTENSSKNRAGGISQLRVTNKVVSVYAIPDMGVRCHVFVLDTYFSKLSQEAFKRIIFTCKLCHLQTLKSHGFHVHLLEEILWGKLFKLCA